MIRFQNLESTCDFYGLMFSNIFLSQDVRNLYCAFPLPSPVRGNNCPLGVWWCEAHREKCRFPPLLKNVYPSLLRWTATPLLLSNSKLKCCPVRLVGRAEKTIGINHSNVPPYIFFIVAGLFFLFVVFTKGSRIAEAAASHSHLRKS